MIIMSEITGGKYKTVDECLAAEKAFLDKKAAEEKAKAEKQKKINDAYDKAIKACEPLYILEASLSCAESNDS